MALLLYLIALVFTPASRDGLMEQYLSQEPSDPGFVSGKRK